MQFQKLTTTVLLLSIFSIKSYAQSSDESLKAKKLDSLKMSYLRQAALKYPMLRQAGFSKEIVGREHVESDLYGNKLAESEVRITRIRANFNLPVVTSGKTTIAATAGLLQQRIDLAQTKSFNTDIPVSDMTIDKSTINIGASITRPGTLFKKPILLSATVAGLTDQMFSTLRLNLIGLAAITLKRTATTSYSVGLLVLVDPSAPTPFIPYFSYWHKFDNNVELFFDLPTKLSLRKQVSPKAAVSLGTELSGTSAFVNLKYPSLPQNNLYSTLELKTGPTFEYVIAKNLVFGVSGGLFSTVSSRIYERSAKNDDYFIKNKMGSTPYINLSISILPFLRGL